MRFNMYIPKNTERNGIYTQKSMACCAAKKYVLNVSKTFQYDGNDLSVVVRTELKFNAVDKNKSPACCAQRKESRIKCVLMKPNKTKNPSKRNRLR